ncbi:MAG: hypothetical protein AB3N07_07235 [Ruegeria sp.]
MRQDQTQTDSSPDSVPAKRYDVVGKRRSPTAKSTRSVLKLLDSGTAQLSHSEFKELHIHHIDAENAEVFWCRVNNSSSLLKHAFYYQGIRENAIEGYSVSFDNLNAWQRPLDARPIFVFSIGRCGSTLFAKVCDVAGLMTWSEPDAFTNLATDPRLNKTPKQFRMLSRVALVDLADKAKAAGKSNFGIKLRAPATAICEDLCGHHPNSVCYFMVREPISWARSWHRLWGSKPVRLANSLSQKVEEVRLAKSRGLNVQILTYEALIEDPETQVRKIARHANAPEVDMNKLNTVLETDAQKSTTVGRSSGSPVSEDFDQQFVAALRKRAPRLLETNPENWLS